VIRIRVNLGDSNQSKFGLKAISDGSKRGAMRKIGRVGGAATCGALTDLNAL
jgi:hypothetical protein